MEKQQSNKKYISSFLLLVTLMTITYCYIFKNCNFEMLGRVIKQARHEYLVVGLILMLVYIVLEGVNFRIIGHSLGHSLSFIKSFCYACIDLYFCGITPSATGGQPVLAYYMTKDGIPISKSSIMILLYTVRYKTVLLLLGIIVSVVHFDFVLQSNLTVVLFTVGIIINIIVIAVCLMCMYSRKVVETIVIKTIEFLGKVHIIKEPETKKEVFYSLLADYHQSAEFVKENPRVLARMFVVTLIQRLAYFAVGYCVYKSFGRTGYGLQDIIALQVVISITVDSLPLPGAVGVSEGMFLLLYTKVYGATIIAPAMLLTRGINFYMMLLLTGIMTMGFHFFKNRPAKVLKGESIE